MDRNVHVLDWTCKAQRHVTRSTFAAELFAAGDAVEQGMLVAQILHETEKGELSAGDARQLREQGGFLPVALYVDTILVFAATTATFVRTPAEKSLLCHVQFLRDLLDKRVLTSLIWIDTRDVISDGLTKGSINREDIRVTQMTLRTICQFRY